MSRNPEYDAARRQALAARSRKPAKDPQTPLSRPPVAGQPTRTLCICGDDGPCTCAPAPSLAAANPPPEVYEAEEYSRGHRSRRST